MAGLMHEHEVETDVQERKAETVVGARLGDNDISHMERDMFFREATWRCKPSRKV
jgi:hypothetical protein